MIDLLTYNSYDTILERYENYGISQVLCITKDFDFWTRTLNNSSVLLKEIKRNISKGQQGCVVGKINKEIILPVGDRELEFYSQARNISPILKFENVLNKSKLANKNNIYFSLKYQNSSQKLIYFVRAEGTDYVKIGETTNIDKRIQSLQTGNPNNLILEIVTNVDNEKSIHEALSEYHHNNEWFLINDESMNRIKKDLKENYNVIPYEDIIDKITNISYSLSNVFRKD